MEEDNRETTRDEDRVFGLKVSRGLVKLFFTVIAFAIILYFLFAGEPSLHQSLISFFSKTPINRF